MSKYREDVGFPHSNEQEQSYEEGAMGWITPNVWRLKMGAPMKGALRSVKPRAGQLVSSNINSYEARTPDN